MRWRLGREALIGLWNLALQAQGGTAEPCATSLVAEFFGPVEDYVEPWRRTIDRRALTFIDHQETPVR